MLELREVEFYYEKNRLILKNISLKIEERKLYVIMGENGSGKSTLLMTMKGINQIKKGEILYKDKIIKKERFKKMEFLNEVGFVFQDPNIQIVGLDVESDIQFGPINLNWSQSKIDESVERVMKQLDIYHLKDKSPFSLSYGEKKRVSIAGILAMNPEILLLDEPTTWLDPWHKKQLENYIYRLNQEGKTIVLSTHDLPFAKSLNCNYIFIKDGEIVAQGGIELFEDLELLKRCRLE